MEHNFEKYNSTSVDTQNTPYDYGSVMHYGPNGFSTNGQPTIVPKQSGVTIGQRHNMSAIDIQEVRLFYNCSSTGSTFPPISTTTSTRSMTTASTRSTTTTTRSTTTSTRSTTMTSTRSTTATTRSTTTSTRSTTTTSTRSTTTTRRPSTCK